jgi:hypothetical protein
MKKLLIVLAFGLFSCSSSDDSTPAQEAKCYTILARGTSPDGDFIIIKYENFVQKKYAVANYLDWLNQTKLCEPITLTEIPL